MTHEHHHEHSSDDAGLAELLDLDAEVLQSHLADVTDWIRQQAADLTCRRIVDLGAGTGTGTIALAERFPDADVIAVDSSEQMLGRVRHKAVELGLAERVTTVQADLDATWPALEPVDVVWASMSLHHLADPDRVLTNVLGTLRPGGVLAALEFDAPLRFLPDAVDPPGLETRLVAAVAQEHASSVPLIGSDWGARLEHVGFASTVMQTFTIDLAPPHPASTGRYAQAFLERMRGALEGRVSSADLTAVDALIDSDAPDGLLHRNDLHVRGTRTVWLARRP